MRALLRGAGEALLMLKLTGDGCPVQRCLKQKWSSI